MNIVDKFLYRLMVGFILLLSVVLLDKYQIVEYDYLKSECSEHFNALNLINKINPNKRKQAVDFVKTYTKIREYTYIYKTFFFYLSFVLFYLKLHLFFLVQMIRYFQ